VQFYHYIYKKACLLRNLLSEANQVPGIFFYQSLRPLLKPVVTHPFFDQSFEPTTHPLSSFETVASDLAMATSSGSVFGATLKTITTTKLEELAKQRAVFEEEYAALTTAAKAEADPLKRVCLLLDGSKTCLGFQTEKETKDGRVGRVISGTSRNLRLETDLKNLDRFVEQARFDPSVSNKVLSDWEKTLLQYLSVQSTKYQYADLYGKLVTEWLSSEKSATDDGDVEMGESFEEVPGAKKLASRAAWEKDVFQAAEVDEQALRSYLDELFQTNKKDSSAAIRELRKTVENFEANLNYSTPFDPHSLRSTIEGLLNSDLLSNEKREALRDFLDNGKYRYRVEIASS